jgi:hypothetical protein
LFGRWFESALASPEMVVQPACDSKKSSRDESQPEDESKPATTKGAVKVLSIDGL